MISFQKWIRELLGIKPLHVGVWSSLSLYPLVVLLFHPHLSLSSWFLLWGMVWCGGVTVGWKQLQQQSSLLHSLLPRQVDRDTAFLSDWAARHSLHHALGQDEESDAFFHQMGLLSHLHETLRISWRQDAYWSGQHIALLAPDDRKERLACYPSYLVAFHDKQYVIQMKVHVPESAQPLMDIWFSSAPMSLEQLLPEGKEGFAQLLPSIDTEVRPLALASALGRMLPRFGGTIASAELACLLHKSMFLKWSSFCVYQEPDSLSLCVVMRTSVPCLGEDLEKLHLFSSELSVFLAGWRTPIVPRMLSRVKARKKPGEYASPSKLDWWVYLCEHHADDRDVQEEFHLLFLRWSFERLHKLAIHLHPEVFRGFFLRALVMWVDDGWIEFVETRSVYRKKEVSKETITSWFLLLEKWLPASKLCRLCRGLILRGDLPIPEPIDDMERVMKRIYDVRRVAMKCFARHATPADYDEVYSWLEALPQAFIPDVLMVLRCIVAPENIEQMEQTGIYWLRSSSGSARLAALGLLSRAGSRRCVPALQELIAAEIELQSGRKLEERAKKLLIRLQGGELAGALSAWEEEDDGALSLLDEREGGLSVH